MKVLLFSEGKKLFSRSGVGVALKHQMQALKAADVAFTLDPRDSYELVHINTLGLKSWKVLKNAKERGIPVIYHTHTTYEDFRNSFLFSNQIAPLLKRQLIKRYSTADYLIFPSKYTESLIRSYGINTPGTVVSNGVDTTLFRKNETLAKEFKNSFKIKSPLIVNVGLPLKRKGLIDFVEVARRFPEYSFIWIGAKFSAIQPFSVKKVIRKSPKNLLFPGYLSFEMLLGALSAADVFFFPSYEENEGIAVLEACSMKCPVVIRDIPVYQDWMVSGENCLKASDIDGFCEAINMLLSDREHAIKLGENAAKVAQDRDLRIVGKKLKEVYSHVMGGANE
ncbi:glycosyl transferase family 1 [Kosmotoga arenicorallina S304]|uniref:Glycosyl transferase family 1 n=1 Tax=Kosmotoga arenicorallina S304 TaxID=1453497 RepID=A0A176K079_9BACT|nr:glycosyltransferase family 4 protein [Kosmotoga arenicorallina]OAA30039.1 glycosyl transferase family 1 [Kosmotoga arenicorallina S304]